MEGGSNSLVSSVWDHYTRAWNMLAEMIDSIPEEEWTRGGMVPARHVVHIIVGGNVFVGDIPLDGWDPTEFLGTQARPGGPWNFTPGELWSKEVALSKLAEMRETVEGSLAKLDDAALLEPETVHPWTGQTRLGKMIYDLRHIQHHLGAISAELKRRGIRPFFRRWD
jgi:hypothetical protein